MVSATWSPVPVTHLTDEMTPVAISAAFSSRMWTTSAAVVNSPISWTFRVIVPDRESVSLTHAPPGMMYRLPEVIGLIRLLSVLSVY